MTSVVTTPVCIIPGVPRYFKPYVNDCFSNALGACLAFHHLDPDLVLTDYLNLMVDPGTGFLGNNYIYKPHINRGTVFGEDELNTSYPLCRYIPPGLSPGEINEKKSEDAINIIMHTEDDNQTAAKEVIEELQKGNPVHMAVDLYYMPYHPLYRKDHILHYVVLYGYDCNKNEMYIFDTHALTGSNFDGAVDMELISRARGSDNPQSNPLIGEFSRPIKNSRTRIIIPGNFSPGMDSFVLLLEESCKRLKGKKEVLDCPCGTGVIDIITRYLQDLDLSAPETLFLFKKYYVDTFKLLSRSRYRFLHWLSRYFHSQDYCAKLLHNSGGRWDVAAHICYKLSLTKRKHLVNEICSELKGIQDLEEQAASELEKLLMHVKTFFKGPGAV